MNRFSIVGFCALTLLTPARPALAAEAAQGPAQVAAVVGHAADFAVSPPLRDVAVRQTSARAPRREAPAREIPLGRIPRAPARRLLAPEAADPVVQRSAPSPRIAEPLQTFEGVGNLDGVLPPDNNGDVGLNHYVEMVNMHIGIYDKVTGTNLVAPFLMSSLYAAAGFGPPASTSDDGDPIVLYDHLANRWLISQFIVSVSPCHEVIAISQTPDPTGAWYLYDFVMPNTKMNDYPHLGVWPDGYYMTDNQFVVPGYAWGGAGVFAFDRAKMLAGDPSATYQYFDLYGVDANYGGMLPADLDGPPPPAATPAYFGMVDDSSVNAFDAFYIWKFQVDWTNPANSTFGNGGRPNYTNAVAAFDSTFSGGRNNIPQPGTAQKLDAIADRIMHRLQYRFFGGYETLVACHTVDVGVDHAGVRYYQMQRNLPAGAFAIAEQSSFAPDAAHRWMGSAALDSQGNLAVGYSVSSTSIYPSIRYAGRMATDPAGGLFQGEATMFAGSGSQTHSAARWGDYTALTVDPEDDLTFWYVNEYLPATSSAGWHTRIGSFRLGISTMGTLTGIVTNELTGEGIDDATVATTNGYGTITANGGFYTRNLPTGTFAVAASALDYHPSPAVQVAIQEGVTTVQNFALSPIPLRVQPRTDVAASGSEGGPFAPDQAVYQLTNASLSTLNWTAASDQAWAELSGASGALAPGAATALVVRITHAADFLAAGSYTAAITISNASGIEAHRRLVKLSIAPYIPDPFVCHDFESGLPAGWSVLTNADQTALSSWRFDDPGTRGNRTGGSGPFAIVDEDLAGSAANTDTEMLTGPFDLRTYAQVYLQFSADYRDYQTEIAEVDVKSSRTGGAWSNVWRVSGSDFQGRVQVDISHVAAGASNAVVRFHYDDNGSWGWWWEVDDVCLSAIRAGLSGGLSIRPIPGLAASGYAGGPFAPDRVYELTNTSASSIAWTTVVNSAWVEAIPSAGAIDAAGATQVNVRISAAAGALAPGAYTAEILFSNVTEQLGQTRPVGVTILDTLNVQPAAGYAAGGLEGGPFAPSNGVYSLSNPSANTLTWTCTWSQAWLDVQPRGGDLAGGSTQAVECAPISPLLVVPGVYSDTLVFSNLTTGAAYTRAVTVTVIEITGEIEVNDSIAPAADLQMPFGVVSVAAPRTEQVVVMNAHATRSLVINSIQFGFYQEDFDDGLAQDWREDADASWSVVGGEYKAETLATDFMTAVYTGQQWGAVGVRADLRRTGDAYNSHGVALRASPNFDLSLIGSAYVFLLSGDAYAVFWLDGTSYGALQGWTQSSAIRFGGPNTLIASADGEQLRLHVNGTLVWEGTDARFASGCIGVAGYNSSSAATVHYFDNVYVDAPGSPGLGIGRKQRYLNSLPQPSSTVEGVNPRPKSPVKVAPAAPVSPAGPTNAGPFAVSGLPALPVTLTPGGSLLFDVTYAPLGVGSNAASLAINNNDNSEPVVSVMMSGRAAAGAVTGLVWAAHSGLPLSNVLVRAMSGAEEKGRDETDSGGAFLLQVPTGAYDLHATLAGYTTGSAVNVLLPADGAVTGVNFTLSGSLLSLTPDAISETLNYGAVATNYMTVSNSGPLTVSVAVETVPASDWVHVAALIDGIEPGAATNVPVLFDTRALPNVASTNQAALSFAGGFVNSLSNLALTLVLIPDALTVSPMDAFAASGPRGGPLAPQSKVYALTNRSASSLGWSASRAASWLTIAPTNGVLAAGGSASVTAALESAAAYLPEGTYTDAVQFANLASGVSQSRNATLNIEPPPPVSFLCFPFDSNPGWSVQGQWAFGQPTGAGSTCHDPASGHTGNNVYGYNLAGDYPNNMPAYDLTTTPLDCSGYRNIQLQFWRWLGVEDALWDEASIAVSVDGATWTNIWEHTGSSVCDGQWIQVTYDLPALANTQATVYIRWRLGPTDTSVTYPGWNIDDVCLLGNPVEVLRVTPASGLDVVGFQGGPFSPSHMDYTLQNLDVVPMDWTAGADVTWADAAPSSGTLPAGGTTTVTVAFTAQAGALAPGAYAGTVAISNATAGGMATRPLAIEIAPARTNLLNNPSFEFAGSAADRAAYWQYNTPDIHGDSWGTAARVDWRHYPTNEGAWCGAIRGTWSGAGDNGGFWQEVPAVPGGQYRFSARFWADDGHPFGPWTAAAQAMKIEFMSGELTGGSYLGSVTQQIAGVTQDWKQVSVQGLTPPGCDWVRVVIYAAGVGSAGSLHVDSVSLEGAPPEMLIEPSDTFVVTGEQGGPFVPPSREYRVANTGTNDFSWSAAASASWLSLSSSGGSAPAGSTQTVTATVNAYAGLLPVGDYPATISFGNPSSGLGETRDVVLSVLSNQPSGCGIGLLMSEYVEGSSNNKAVEIYSGSGTVNLKTGNYYLQGYHNGAGSPTYSIALTGTVEAGSAYVVVYSSASTGLLAKANQLTTSLNFNGDDALVLRSGGTSGAIVDSFGQMGFDPGTAWGVSPNTTLDHTLRRKPAVTSGDTMATNVFDPALEWTFHPTDTFDGLGTHIEGGATCCRSLVVSSQYGQADPAQGTYFNDCGSVALCRLTNRLVTLGTTQYASRGWTGTGSAPPSGPSTNTGPFFLEANSTVVWLWSTNYLLQTSSEGPGTVGPGAGWHPAGSNVLVSAQPADYFHVRWTGNTNGAVTLGNDILVPMNQPRSLVAVFEPNLAPLGTPEWWLALHGLTNDSFALEELKDPDEDGHFNWEEQVAGTIPTNRFSILLLRAAPSAVPGSSVLFWDSATGRFYTVNENTNLLADWRAIAGATNLAGTGATMTNVPPSSESAPRLFELRVRQQP